MRATRKNQPKLKQNTQQASRGLKSAPPGFELLLDTVNMVPPEAEMLDVFEVWKQLQDKEAKDFGEWSEADNRSIQDEAPAEERLPPDYPKRVIEYINRVIDYSHRVTDKIEALSTTKNAATEAINRCLEGMPEKLRVFVWQVGEQHGGYRVVPAIARYNFVRQSRENLRIIARIASKNLNWMERYLASTKIEFQASIQIDDDGIIRVNRDIFSATVEDVEASRIRECAICRRIFWAGRTTQQGCSTACSHALRNRRYRAKYKDYLIRRHMKESATLQQESKESNPRRRKSNSKKEKTN